MSLNLNAEQQVLLDKILSKTGDLNFKRRIITMLEYLDIKSTDNVLDMGCGEGFYTMIFAKVYGCNIVAVDYDEEILLQAKKWIEDLPNLRIIQADICNLPFDDNTFDKIVCTEVLEHIIDDKKATSELYRVLKPKGILGVTVPNKNYPFVWDPLNKIREGLGLGHFNPKNGFWGGIWAYDHKRLYLPQDLKNLLTTQGFELKELKTLTHYGLPFNHLILYTGKMFYTNLPVSDDIKNSMEKFSWDTEPVKNNTSLLSSLINKVFALFKYVDSFNDKEFSLNTSTMAVAAKVVKP